MCECVIAFPLSVYTDNGLAILTIYIYIYIYVDIHSYIHIYIYIHIYNKHNYTSKSGTNVKNAYDTEAHTEDHARAGNRGFSATRACADAQRNFSSCQTFPGIDPKGLLRMCSGILLTPHPQVSNPHDVVWRSCRRCAARQEEEKHRQWQKQYVVNSQKQRFIAFTK